MSSDVAGKRSRDWSTYKRLLGYVRPHWALFAIAVLGFLVGSGAEAYFVNLFGALVDDWDAGAARAAFFIPFAMLGAAVVRGLGEVVGELLLSQVSFTVVHNLRMALFEQLLHMPSRYFDGSSQGHLVSRITFNVAQLRDTGTDALKTIIQDGGKVIVFLGCMLYLNWQLTLIFIAAVPVVAVVVLYASRRFRGIAKRIQNAMGDVTHVASEAISGYRVVRIFGGEDTERRRFDRASRANRRRNLKMVVTKATSTQVVQILVVAAVALLIATLARPDVAHGLSTGDLVVFLGLAGMLARPIRKLTEVNARLQRGLAAAEDVFSQLDAPVERDQGKLSIDRAKGRIEFRGVSFSYGDDQEPALTDIDLVVEPGQTVALVGRSGSGKSTLASLIPRFYEADSGEVRLDGRAVEDYDQATLRRQIALVTQQVNLFNDTVAANIAYGALAGAGPGALEEAARRAHAQEFIAALPQGMNTLVGDDGVLLSGGQRQRIAIARALLKDAPILILDEATSALDSESERHIHAALEEAMRGRTTLIIAHRLSTVENADLIYVMDDGRIVEQGDHDALMALGGLYARLYDAHADSGSHGAPAPVPVPQAGKPGSDGGGVSALAKGWYEGAWWNRLLAPAAWLWRRVVERRRGGVLSGRSGSWRAPVPVIVVGNITIGGTGKTPLVIWLVRWLQQRGLRPGVVSRGYGGKGNRSPLAVPSAGADASRCGDEPVLIAARTNCPVVVCRNRVKAVQTLLKAGDVDVVVADDGLQHYALARDVEIAVVDGHRGLGNGRLLPAGPLREPAERLKQVDWVVSNGRACSAVPEASLMRMRPVAFINLGTGESLPPTDFAACHERVHAVAGIGNPDRFARLLDELGVRAELHAFADHHRFSGTEIVYEDGAPVVCTDKDAVKLSRLGVPLGHCWRLQVAAEIEASGEERLHSVLVRRGIL
ncbi:MAG: lipid A export permease/ATP-binding protein MsbA [Gammaproteobacteria bacterium]|nr:lipid A export permease/ATP-binding protein MsbA [Gammaproteobacteria bacterium]MYH14187.1 lipid A export permease/ATP-binding protein MsbA [Gammaproteobacteria bacterium]MYK82670.1 lipid A export permease/ATP-binding protein MsbA [Gammaproteobacteria bacterium]